MLLLASPEGDAPGGEASEPNPLSPNDTSAAHPGSEAQAPETPTPAKWGSQFGNALQRQSSSVQRQLGQVRQSQGGFFLSSWFSDHPVNPLASTGTPTSPPDCEPIDNSIAEAFMRESATREGISLDLVREVVRRESGFRPCAVSPKGAMGMMQLMPDTATSLSVADPFDPRQNIDGGVRFLRRLLNKYNGRPDLALAAYNAGEGAVDKANGVPDFTETKEYVSTILQKVFEAPPSRPTRNGINRTGINRNTPGRVAPFQAQPGRVIESPPPPAVIVPIAPEVGPVPSSAPQKATLPKPALQ